MLLQAKLGSFPNLASDRDLVGKYLAFKILDRRLWGQGCAASQLLSKKSIIGSFNISKPNLPRSDSTVLLISSSLGTIQQLHNITFSDNDNTFFNGLSLYSSIFCKSKQ